MARIELRMDGKSLRAQDVLGAATGMAKLLRSIEREVTGKRRATIVWHVDIQTGFFSTLIALRTVADDGDVADSVAKAATAGIAQIAKEA